MSARPLTPINLVVDHLAVSTDPGRTVIEHQTVAGPGALDASGSGEAAVDLMEGQSTTEAVELPGGTATPIADNAQLPEALLDAAEEVLSKLMC